MQFHLSGTICRLAVSCALSQAVAVPAFAQQLFVKETAASLPGYNIYRPADLATRRTRAPVITWINGGCAPSDSGARTLFERWASAGYFVITVNDPNAPSFRRPQEQGGARGAPAAGGGPGASAQGAMPQLPPGTTAASTIAAMMADSPEKQAKAIDWAEKENKTKGGPYAGKLDVKRIVASGNSCGGISSLNWAARDKRPRTIFVLSGSSLGPMAAKEAVGAIMGKIAAPVVFVVGGTEDIARGPANLDYDMLTPGVAAAVIERASGDHAMISRNVGVQRDAAEMGLLWFRATLYGDKAAAAVVASKGCGDCDPKIWTVKSKNLLRR